MLKGVPTKRPVAPRSRVAAVAAARVPATAAAVAQEAGLDPAGPEMAALIKLSHDVVERIVWEVVPVLAETIIRENLDQLAKAEERLKVLDKACFFGCEEYSELKEKIAAYKAKTGS